jgi:hypothetical protein
MQKRVFISSLLLLSLVLVSCSYFTGAPEGEEQASSSEQSSSLLSEEELVTRNVTYTGLLEEGGVTIYQEGSFRLTLSDGKMVLLESEADASLPLNLYVGKYVEVQGDVRPTVEAGGTIMAVSTIEWIRRETNEEGEEVEMRRVLCGGGAEGACPEGFTCTLEETPGICMQDEEEGDEGVEGEESGDAESSSSAQSSSSSQASVAQQSSSSSSSSISSVVISDTDVAVMAGEDLAAGRWTQEYCSEHMSFCIPVHKNWYFKSFGTVGSLWHVEVRGSPLENLGEGPIAVDLRTGDLASLSMTDGDIVEANGRVVGYRMWSDNRHFEISADAALRASVEFMTQGLKASQ